LLIIRYLVFSLTLIPFFLSSVSAAPHWRLVEDERRTAVALFISEEEDAKEIGEITFLPTRDDTRLVGSIVVYSGFNSHIQDFSTTLSGLEVDYSPAAVESGDSGIEFEIFTHALNEILSALHIPLEFISYLFTSEGPNTLETPSDEETTPSPVVPPLAMRRSNSAPVRPGSWIHSTRGTHRGAPIGQGQQRRSFSRLPSFHSPTSPWS
jgi:hypothetical protein